MTTHTVVMLDRRATPEHLGLIPTFLDSACPLPAVKQFDANYQHGGGWHAQAGFTLVRRTGALHYPGDPPLCPLAAIPFRDEVVFIYDYGYVAVVQPDGSFEACRMD